MLYRERRFNMEKNVEVSLLFSFYRNLLTDRQADTVDLYYNEDLSLAEIGDELGISRQGVRDNLKRAEATLYDVEKKLGLAQRFLLIKAQLEEIDNVVRELEKLEEAQNIKLKLNEILDAVSRINQIDE